MNLLGYVIKDLRREKVKTIFGTAGILVSILLLTIIGCLSDSLSYSYMSQVTYEVGSADFTIRKQSSQDLNFNAYFDENIIETNLAEIDDIDNFFTRIQALLSVSHTDTSQNNLEIKKFLITYGLDTVREQESDKMGNLWICDDQTRNPQGELTYERTDALYQGPIPEGKCVVTKSAARLFNLQINDEITIKSASQEEILIIEYIVEPDLRFSRYESSLILVELPWMQDFLDEPNQINNIYATLENPERFYDTDNMFDTSNRLQSVAQEIQKAIGFTYEVSIPKLTQLQSSQNQTDFLNMTFYFIIFFSVLITGILINSILTTSIEERIREFGILRTLGGKKAFTFKMVLLSGFFMGTVGTLVGTVLGTFLGPPFLDWLLSNIYTIQWNFAQIDFIILPWTIFRSLIIGFCGSILISLIPAFKARSINLVDAIDPSRSIAAKEENYRLKKEGSADFKIMGIGLGIAATGIAIFLVLPRLLTGSGGPGILNYVLVGLLILVLIGLVMVTVGIVPLIERFIAQFFKPFIKKYYPVYRINLVRYRRRNLGNIMMFAMTFSFIIFISTSLQMQTNNSAKLFEFQYGSDLVLSNAGTFEQDNVVTNELLEELDNLPGIATAAPINTNSPIDFTKITSAIFQAGEEGFESIDFGRIFGQLPKYESYIGDIGGYQEFYSTLVGIDERYYETTDHSLFRWDTRTGSSAAAIDEVLLSSNKCIIAKVFADALQITDLPAEIKITINNPYQEDSYENITTLEVVGVSEGMPGVWNFRSSQISLYSGSGILVNMDTYAELMEWGNPESEDYVLDKILINLRDNSLENLEKTQDFIENYFGDEFDFILDEATSKINFIEDQNQTQNIIMQTILFFSILVSLFGLIASMYSTMLERMFELGILRAMGLKPHEVRYMLMAEAITIMLSSGILGGIVGWFIAYLLQTNVSIITEVPASTAVDPFTILATFGISVIISIAGMFLITRKVEKMEVIDVIRATF